MAAPFANVRHAAASDVGRKRSNNEDAFGAFPEAGVYCVADGMGGGEDGEIASSAVVRAVGEFAASHPLYTGAAASGGVSGLTDAIGGASAWIFDRAREKRLGSCGSTVVALLLGADAVGEAVALHAGDSRLYLVRGGEIRQITRDHSAAEMMGAKSEEELNPLFRGMILRAVGTQRGVELEETRFEVSPGDRFVLCSDGLNKMIGDAEIAAVVSGAASPDEAAAALVAAANDAGGDDNVTAVVVEVPGASVGAAASGRGGFFARRRASVAAVSITAAVAALCIALRDGGEEEGAVDSSRGQSIAVEEEPTAIGGYRKPSTAIEEPIAIESSREPSTATEEPPAPPPRPASAYADAVSAVGRSCKAKNGGAILSLLGVAPPDFSRMNAALRLDAAKAKVVEIAGAIRAAAARPGAPDALVAAAAELSAMDISLPEAMIRCAEIVKALDKDCAE